MLSTNIFMMKNKNYNMSETYLCHLIALSRKDNCYLYISLLPSSYLKMITLSKILYKMALRYVMLLLLIAQCIHPKRHVRDIIT